MANVFICYSRKDIDFMRDLARQLRDKGHQVWFDTQIEVGDRWKTRIRKIIAGYAYFLYIISPDSLDSEACADELQFAIEFKKRIVPVYCRSVDQAFLESATTNGQSPSIPQQHMQRARAQWAEVHLHNWADCRTDLAAGLKEADATLTALTTHQAKHNELSALANEWSEHPKDASYLLTGTLLKEAELWLEESEGKEPPPSTPQMVFIQASRKRQRQIARGIIVVLASVLVIISILAGYVAYYAKATSDANHILQAQALAGQANAAVVNNQIDQAMLLAVEAHRHQDTFETRNALLNSLEYSPHLETVLQSGSTDQALIVGLSYDARGATLMAAQMLFNGESQILIWDMASHALLQTIQEPSRLIGAALSPDGTIVAAAGVGAGVVLRDARSGRVRAQLNDPTLLNPVTAITGMQIQDILQPNIVFSPDGSLLATWGCVDSACHQGQVLVWEMPGGTLAESLPLDVAPLGVVLAFSADSHRLAASACDAARCQMRVWNMPKGNQAAPAPLIIAPPLQPGGILTTLAFSPDGSDLAVGICRALPCAQGQILFIDPLTGAIGVSPPGHATLPFIISEGETDALTFSPDGQRLLVGSVAGTLQFWDVATGQNEHIPLSGHTGKVAAVIFSSDGIHFVSASQLDFKILLWSLQPFTSASLIPGQRLDGNSQVAYSPDGRLLATGDCRQEVHLWDAATGQHLAMWSTPGAFPAASAECVNSLAFSPDHRYIAAGMLGGSVYIWDSDQHQITGQFHLLGTVNVVEVAFSPDSHYLAFATQITGAYVLEVPTARLVRSFTAKAQAFSGIAFSPDSRTLAVGINSTADDSALELWDLAHNQSKHIFALGGQTAPNGLAFSSDGRTLAGVNDIGDLTLWDAQTYQTKAVLTFAPPALSAFEGVTFNPAGTLLAVYEGQTLTLWDARTLALSVRPLLEPAMIRNVAFSPDGQYLAVAEYLGPVDVRYATMNQWEAAACRIAHRNLTSAEWRQFLPGTSYQQTCPEAPNINPAASPSPASRMPYTAHAPGPGCDTGGAEWLLLNPDALLTMCQHNGVQVVIPAQSFGGIVRFFPPDNAIMAPFIVSLHVDLTQARESCVFIAGEASHQAVFGITLCATGTVAIQGSDATSAWIGSFAPSIAFAIQASVTPSRLSLSVNGQEVMTLNSSLPDHLHSIQIGLESPRSVMRDQTAILSDFVYG